MRTLRLPFPPFAFPTHRYEHENPSLFDTIYFVYTLIPSQLSCIRTLRLPSQHIISCWAWEPFAFWYYLCRIHMSLGLILKCRFAMIWRSHHAFDILSIYLYPSVSFSTASPRSQKQVRVMDTNNDKKCWRRRRSTRSWKIVLCPLLVTSSASQWSRRSTRSWKIVLCRFLVTSSASQWAQSTGYQRRYNRQGGNATEGGSTSHNAASSRPKTRGEARLKIYACRTTRYS